MRINPISIPMYSTSFKSTRSEENPASETTVKQLLRDRLESNLDSTAFHIDEIGEMPDSRVEQMLKHLKTMHVQSPKLAGAKFQSASKEEVNVDRYKMQSSIRGAWERRKNELYTGPYFITQDEIPKIKVLKDCGIKSVLALCHYDPYGENCEKAGLNYIGLNQIGNKTLHPFIIKRDRNSKSDLITDLVNNKNMWMDGRSDKKTSDLKEFIKILNGQNEDYPFPIYYGCTQGTNMTSCWNDLYNILKNEDMNAPLSDEVVEKLARLRIEIDDVYRS